MRTDQAMRWVEIWFVSGASDHLWVFFMLWNAVPYKGMKVLPDTVCFTFLLYVYGFNHGFMLERSAERVMHVM